MYRDRRPVAGALHEGRRRTLSLEIQGVLAVTSWVAVRG